jgi:flavin reductase (DIM6/NTAB) family NADH-FMN oxidoreductase RutF
MLFDFEALPARERYKLLVSTVVPRPIAWVVSQDAAGVVNAAPYSFFNCFADDPPIVAFSAGPRESGDRKDTLANIQATGEFVVCLVSEATMERMVVTAADFPPGVDELDAAGLATLPSERVKPPRIAESPVAMECALHQIVPLGRHNVVLGRVRAMHVADACVINPEKHYIDTPKLGLVGRMHGGGWYARTTDRVEVPRLSVAEAEARRAAKG